MTLIRPNPEDLERALAEIQASGLTAEEFLARRSDAAALAPLLEVAGRIARDAASAPRLSQRAFAAGERRVLTHFRAHSRAAPARFLHLRWAVALVALIAALGTGVGAASASSAALPGDLLYPIKRLVESTQLALAPPPARPALQIQQAEVRLQELQTLAGRG